MATIKEKLDADLAAARAEVAKFEAQIAALPAELHAIEETRWQEIVAWFKAHL